MKRLSILFILIIFSGETLLAQERPLFCGTEGSRVRLMPDSAAIQRQLAALNLTENAAFAVKLFFVVINSSSIPSSIEAGIHRQVKYMQQRYANQDICFVLSGITYIDNPNLRYMNVSTETSLLLPYLRSGHITIFVHDEITDNDGNNWAGWAYDIPNHFCSVDASTLPDDGDNPTLAHEIGHDLGLYHTFQAWKDANGNTIRENVARSGFCRNCDSQGDFLCDTDADRQLTSDDVNAQCQVLISAMDACNVPLVFEPTNLMAYGRGSCGINVTNGQGTRSRAFLTTEPLLITAIAASDFTLSSPFTYNSGERIFSYRNTVTVNTGSNTNNIIFTGSSKTYISAGEVTVRPNTTFTPSASDGVVRITAGSYCN